MDSNNVTYLFFKHLEYNSIRYCVLRNYDFLPYSTNGSDLDLLIHREDLYKFFSTFKEFVSKYEIVIVSFIDSKYCPKICLMKGFSSLQIDVFKGGIFFGNKEIIQSDIIFEEVFIHNNIFVLNSKISTILSFLKELLNNGTCKEKYIIDLKKTFGSRELEYKYFNQFGLKFFDYLKSNILKLDSLILNKLYLLSKENFEKSIFFDFSGKLKRIFKQPGYFVVFLGTDGSGKSTIINKISYPLLGSFHNSVYYEHSRPNHLPSLAQFLGKKEDFSSSVSNPHGSSSSGFLGSFFRWSYYSVDYTFGFYQKVWRKKTSRSCIWIFDRYYYDYLIDPKRSRIKLPFWILKVGQFFIPEPDLIFCLGTDPILIRERKPELSLKEIERQVFELKKFSNNHPRAIWVDTGGTIEKSTNEVLQFLIQYMAKRFQNLNFK